jgi:hypothetical protein
MNSIKLTADTTNVAPVAAIESAVARTLVRLSATQIRIINALRPFISASFSITKSKLTTDDSAGLINALAQFAPVNPRSINALIKSLQGGSSTVPPVAVASIPEETLPVTLEVVETPVVIVAPVTNQTEEDWLLADEPVVDMEKLSQEATLNLGAGNVTKLGDCSWRKPAQPKVTRDWWSIGRKTADHDESNSGSTNGRDWSIKKPETTGGAVATTAVKSQETVKPQVTPVTDDDEEGFIW